MMILITTIICTTIILMLACILYAMGEGQDEEIKRTYEATGELPK